MPVCTVCSAPFKNQLLIEGKIRNLQRRTRCLSCMPFGSPKTTYLKGCHKNKSPMLAGDNKVVCSCGRVYTYDKKKGHTRTKCNSCMANTRRFALKQKCVSYLGGACKLCGYSKSLGALIFHHINPDEKEFGIGGAHTIKWTRIKQELDKCVLLCANCHAEVHSGMVTLSKIE